MCRQIPRRVGFAVRHVFGRHQHVEVASQAGAVEHEVDFPPQGSRHHAQPEAPGRARHELGRARHQGKRAVDQPLVDLRLRGEQLLELARRQPPARAPERLDQTPAVIEPEEVGVVLLAGEWQALFRENSAQRFPMLLLVVRDHSVEVEQHRFDHAPSSIIPRRPVRFVEQFHGVTRPGGQPGGGEPGSELHDATGIAGCDDMRRRGAQRLDLGRQHGA